MRKSSSVIWLMVFGGILAILFLVLTNLVDKRRSNDFGYSPMRKEIKYDYDKYLTDFTMALDDEAKLEMTDAYLADYPDSALALGNKAYLLIKNGDFEEGILLNEQVIELHGGVGSAYNNISWAYHNLDYYELVLYYADRAIEENDGRPTYSELVNKADGLKGLERLEEAADFYLQAITDFFLKDQANSFYAHEELAEIYQTLEETTKELDLYKKILEFEPSDSSAFIRIISIYQDRNDIDNILAYGESYFENNTDVIYEYSRFAATLDDLGYHEMAGDYYLKYAEGIEYKGYGYYQAAKSYKKAGNLELAEKYLNICIEFDPEYESYAAEDVIWEVDND